MDDQWLNDNLVVDIEKDVFVCIDNEAIIQYCQNIKTHREQLKKCLTMIMSMKLNILILIFSVGSYYLVQNFLINLQNPSKFIS